MFTYNGFLKVFLTDFNCVLQLEVMGTEGEES